ncbi:MAG: carbohydrate-binding domain-containing protein [Bacilli bacterium]|nr:carbohydrate-binding domain-containing protein [Bacilli bacterium]
MKNRRLILLPCLALLAMSISSCNVSPNNPSHGEANQSQNDTAVNGVSLSYEKLTMYKGKSATLKATVTPDTATNKEVSWTSSNTSVATVNNGVITAISVGTSVITVKTKEGGYTATCALTVIAEEEETPYEPDTTDTDIYFITDSTLSNGTYDSTADEYTFSITKNYKQIYVNAPEKVIVIELNGVTLENNTNSPIYVEDCDTVEISAKKDTTNNIKDTRAAYVTDQEGQGKGAIFVSNGDLKHKGTGTLNITANYLNGIHGKDDVKVQKQTLNITAVNHGIRGNDSVTITSGTINISCGGDGLHSENSDISSKGNQRGNVTINGGSLTINSWSDAIQASYNAIIDQLDDTVPTTFVAKTNKYSSYSGETIDTSTSNFYLKMNSNTYSNGAYTYAAYINGNWYPATYKGTQSSGGQQPGGFGGGGGSRSYYIYQLEKPADATSFTLYRFKGSNITSYSLDTYNAKSDAKAFNSAYDMVQISVNNTTISFSSWSNYASGNTNSADVSAKGIKAENEIYIKKGTIDIKAYDDAIHANNDGIIENGSSPLGNIIISGGNTTVEASDDAIHADGSLTISDGEINVKSAYEGLEANVINISGGSSYVYATDDGVNATSGNATPSINVSGGLLDVEVPTNGDTDGIDSNGSFTQSGGVVIVKGPGNAGGNSMGAAALDTDGAASVSDGTLIIFGGTEKTPTTNSKITKTLCSSNSVASGSHTVSFSNNTSYQTTLKNSSRGCLVYSALGTATLK